MLFTHIQSCTLTRQNADTWTVHIVATRKTSLNYVSKVTHEGL